MISEKLDALERRYDELHRAMEDPTVSMNPTRLREITREISELEPLVGKYRSFKITTYALVKTRQMVREEPDEEMRLLAREEAQRLEADEQHLEQELRLLLLPKDPRDEKDTFVEIRAGTGGEEAALFAADLYRMYTRYAENKGWKVALADENRTGLKGFKEVCSRSKDEAHFHA